MNKKIEKLDKEIEKLNSEIEELKRKKNLCSKTRRKKIDAFRDSREQLYDIFHDDEQEDFSPHFLEMKSRSEVEFELEDKQGNLSDLSEEYDFLHAEILKKSKERKKLKKEKKEELAKLEKKKKDLKQSFFVFFAVLTAPIWISILLIVSPLIVIGFGIHFLGKKIVEYFKRKSEDDALIDKRKEKTDKRKEEDYEHEERKEVLNAYKRNGDESDFPVEHFEAPESKEKEEEKKSRNDNNKSKR